MTTGPALDFRALAQLSNGRLGTTDVACPLCGPNRRSPLNRTRRVLRIWHREPDFASYCCARCGASGWAGEGGRRYFGGGELAKLRATVAKREAATNTWRTAQAASIWHESVDARGTIVEKYLQMRGLVIPGDCELRFHPACPHGEERLPAMVGLMVDIVTNQPTGVHRTFLRPDGSGKALIEPVKMMLGSARGACIKLTPDDEVDLGLGLTEGIETGLAVLKASWAPVWATGSKGGIEKFPVLAGIECLTVFADNDENGGGLAAAHICAERWEKAGREATIRIPHYRSDWNDITGGARS